MKITIIGAGNIGGATANGFARSGAITPSDITVTARHTTTLEKFAARGMRTTTDNCAAVQDADLVLFAVEPWQMEDMIRSLKDALDFERQILVSLAPGIKPEQFLEWLAQPGIKPEQFLEWLAQPGIKPEQFLEWLAQDGTEPSHPQAPLPALAYAIPNIAAEIGESMTYIASVTASDGQTALLKTWFDRIGHSEIVPLDLLLSGTSLASCGIAYALRYLSAAIQGGIKLGLNAEQARDAVCRTVKGAAALLQAHQSDPEEEIHRVTTPNGLTLRGLKAMEEAGFSEAVIRGLTVIISPASKN